MSAYMFYTMTYVISVPSIDNYTIKTSANSENVLSLTVLNIQTKYGYLCKK